MRMTELASALPLRSPPETSGAANGGAQADSAGAGAGNAQATAGNAEAFWTKYDLPDGLKGASAEEAFEKLYQGWKGLRDTTARFAPPKDANSYKFEPSEKLKPYFRDPNDPILALARETAHKLGMPDSLFAPFINGVFEAARDKGLLPDAFDPAAEIAAIAEMVAPGQQGPEARRAVEAALKEAEAFAPALAESLKLSPRAKQLLVEISGEAAGVEVLRALKGAAREFGLQIGGTGVNQGYSWEQYERDVADPRYNPFDPKYDKSFREAVDAKMRALPPR